MDAHSYDWSYTAAMVRHAGLENLFSGNDPDHKEITFFGPTNHTIRRYLLKNGYETVDYEEILSRMAAVLRQGGVVALKGLGGFNLICNAENEKAICRLREIKKRYKKPFAVMFPDVPTLSHYLNILPLERGRSSFLHPDRS